MVRANCAFEKSAIVNLALEKIDSPKNLGWENEVVPRKRASANIASSSKIVPEKTVFPL